MTGVPSQWSAVALWADFRVIGAVVALCVIGILFWAAICFGVSTLIQSVAASVARAVRRP